MQEDNAGCGTFLILVAGFFINGALVLMIAPMLLFACSSIFVPFELMKLGGTAATCMMLFFFIPLVVFILYEMGILTWLDRVTTTPKQNTQEENIYHINGREVSYEDFWTKIQELRDYYGASVHVNDTQHTDETMEKIGYELDENDYWVMK